MDPLAHAASLARALIGLARIEATGVLELKAPHAAARLVLREGRACAIRSTHADAHLLGDLLARDGDLDWRAHREALQRRSPTGGPVGGWLVATGAATGPAVAYALRQQLRLRMAGCFTWQPLDYAFLPEDTADASALLKDPPHVLDLALFGLRRVVSALSPEHIERGLGQGAYEVTDQGRWLSRRAALLPQELMLCRGGAMEGEAVGEPGRRALLLLKLMGAVRARDMEASYRLLLRKARQLRGHSSPAALLDVPQGATPEHARRALRRLALELHPDRLGPAAPEALRQTAHRVMSALNGAERRLRLGA